MFFVSGVTRNGVRRGSHDPAGVPDRRSPALTVGRRFVGFSWARLAAVRRVWRLLRANLAVRGARGRGRRPSRCGWRRKPLLLDRWSDPVNSGDSDWPELTFGGLELLEQFVVPSAGQGHILMDADNPAALRALDSEIQAVGCALAAFDQDDLVGRILAQAR